MTTEQYNAHHTFLDNSIIGLIAHNPDDGDKVCQGLALLVCELEVSLKRWISDHQLTGEWEFLPIRYGAIAEGMHIHGSRYFLDHSAYDRFLLAEEKDLRFVPSVDRAERAEGVRLKPVYDPFSDSIESLIPQVNRPIVGYYLGEGEITGKETPEHYLVFGQVSAFRRHYRLAAEAAMPMSWEAYRGKEEAGVALSTDEIAWRRVVELRRQQSFCDYALAIEREGDLTGFPES